MKTYSEIRQQVKINPLRNLGDGAACFTHYLHNLKNGASKYYLPKAEDFIYKATSSSLQEFLTENIVFDIPFPESENHTFTFIDLFAGIGGFRIAMQNLGGKCVFSSEIDRFAKKTYEANFGKVPFGDITKIDEKDIPEHDILCGGFPCQAFSIAGKRRGFEETRGTLFFEMARIIKEKRPKAIFLENVKGLRNHDKGNTLKTILEVLRDDLDYFVPEPQIMNAKDFGVPQNRERIFIVGFRNDLKITKFDYPKPIEEQKTFSDIKEKLVVPTKYYISETYQKTLLSHKQRHANKGNGFGFELIADNQCANAIVVGGMGRERNIVIDNRLIDFIPTTHIRSAVNKDFWRRMTPREWARLQGFPDQFKIVVSDAQAYKQFGNSVAIPAIQATAKVLVEKVVQFSKKTGKQPIKQS
ncbi:MAG TPA: DNA (cytosine-5-)-methyltransferase [Bacteroidales bacterium]|nr:DNA (cytosine-5-)-methyltransferase [Bacteroidales bacterium]